MTMSRHVFLTAVTLFFYTLLGDGAAQKTDLYFSFMLSSGSTVEQDTSGVAPAVDIALDAINNDSTVLNDYRLNYSAVLNSECDRTASLDTFFGDITSQPTKIFLLGCGCSIATAPVGEISHFWEIIQMSYASLTPLIAYRSAYPDLFSTLPSALTYINVIEGIMNTYDWQKLVVVSQLENEFDLLRETLVGDAENDITAITFHSREDAGEIPTLFSLSSDYRIYFLNMYERHARQVICRASQDSNIMYPRYLFIIPGTYQDQWWTVNDVNCSSADMERVLNHSLVIATYPIATAEDTPTDVHLTLEEFQELYEDSLGPNTATYAAAFAYDALWAMAFAMDSSGINRSFSEFDNQEVGREISRSIKEQLYSLSFIGLTGEVSFNLNGTRQESDPRVLQYRFTNTSTTDLFLVGWIVNSSSEFQLNYTDGESEDTVWPDIVPFDGSPITELRGVLLPLFIYLYVLATAGIILAIACAIVNIALRKRKLIRLTSPNLNNLIVIGCATLMFSAYLYAFPFPNYTVLYVFCIVRAYTQSIGYMLCFGTICAKMGRVYFIFHNPSPSRKRRSIQDWHLVLIVLGLAAVDVAIATISLAIDPYKPREVRYTEMPTGENEYGIQINFFSLSCESDRSIFWIGALFLTKFIIQAAAVFFAFKTRKVKIKALNDAKIISWIIYITSALLTIMLIGAVALRNYLNADAGVFGSGLVIVVAVVLLLLFIPKWYGLYKDPEGKNVFEGGNQPTFSSMAGGVSDQDASKMATRIEELEERLSRHEHVTPFQARKRFLSSAAGGTTGLLNRPRGGVAGGRSMSYSPSPLDVKVTASLPPRMAISPAVSPLRLGNGAGGTTDSGAGTMNSESNENSPKAKNGPIILTIDGVDDNGLASSQTQLIATSNL